MVYLPCGAGGGMVPAEEMKKYYLAGKRETN